MKFKLLLAVVAGCFITIVPVTSIAQNSTMKNSSPEQRASIMTIWMINNLQIAEELVKKINEINLIYAKKIQIVMQKENTGKYEKIKEIQLIDFKKDEELKRIFSAKQFEKYINSKNKLREYVKNRIESGQLN